MLKRFFPPNSEASSSSLVRKFVAHLLSLLYQLHLYLFTKVVVFWYSYASTRLYHFRVPERSNLRYAKFYTRNEKSQIFIRNSCQNIIWPRITFLL